MGLADNIVCNAMGKQKMRGERQWGVTDNLQWEIKVLDNGNDRQWRW